MAILSDGDRALVNTTWMRENNIAWGSLSKADLRAAVNAVDQWIDDNSGSYNSAIPQPARAQLTAKQKAWLLLQVVRRRFDVS